MQIAEEMGKQPMRNLLLKYRRAVICVSALAAVVLAPSFLVDSAHAQRSATHPKAKPILKKKTSQRKALLAKQKRAPASADKNKDATEIIAPIAAPAPTNSEQANIGEFQSVLHARTAKLTTCMDQVVTQSNSVIDRPHTAISSWSKSQPNENFFRSIIGLSYKNTAMPNGAAVLVAAPLPGGRCGGTTVQIYPTAQSCTSLQALLVQKKKSGRIGRTAAMLRDLPVVVTADGASNILMPTAGNGCAMIIVQNVQ